MKSIKNKTNIALVGFMGSGKSSVGRKLAAVLGKEFVEVDDLITAHKGIPITQIFAEEGEIPFRELEIAFIKKVAQQHNQVIVTGGGTVLNKINIDRLRQSSVVVYLKAAPQVILRRVRNDTTRPLLNTADQFARIKDLLAFRKPFYERAADITVNTSRIKIDTIASSIIARLEKDERFNR
jgi:shikimate kinase